MINLLVFDLDGTLFETADGIANAFNSVMKEKELPPVDKKVITSFIGTGLRDLLERLESYYEKNSARASDLKKVRLALSDIGQLEQDFRRHYNDNFLQESFLYPGVLEFLDSWPHKIAIVSNKTEFYVHELVAKTELRRYPWEKLVGGNTFIQKKPHPLPLQIVMQIAQARPDQTLMIGDGLPDIQVANNTGVKSVAVSFGYTPISQLIQTGAHASIDHYNQLSKVVQSLGTI